MDGTKECISSFSCLVTWNFIPTFQSGSRPLARRDCFYLVACLCLCVFLTNFIWLCFVPNSATEFDTNRYSVFNVRPKSFIRYFGASAPSPYFWGQVCRVNECDPDKPSGAMVETVYAPIHTRQACLSADR